MKFAFIDQTRPFSPFSWTVEAEDKHNAIAKAVENGFTEDMADFYYGLDDGQISVIEVTKEIT